VPNHSATSPTPTKASRIELKRGGFGYKTGPFTEDNPDGSRGAEDGIRTRDLNLGKVTLYQLSYFRMGGQCSSSPFASNLPDPPQTSVYLPDDPSPRLPRDVSPRSSTTSISGKATGMTTS
jgi:hypothetical protein